MQLDLSHITERPTFDVSKWIRTRHHWPTFHRIAEPLAALYGTEHDAWKRNDDGTMTYVPDDVWRAACVEADRRMDCYMRKVTF